MAVSFSAVLPHSMISDMANSTTVPQAQLQGHPQGLLFKLVISDEQPCTARRCTNANKDGCFKQDLALDQNREHCGFRDS